MQYETDNLLIECRIRDYFVNLYIQEYNFNLDNSTEDEYSFINELHKI